MHRIIVALLLIACSASAQQLVNCQPNVPCVASGAVSGNSGDPAPVAFGKINANATASYNATGTANPILGVPGAVVANGDTVLYHAVGTFNSTAGSNIVSFGRNIGGNFQLATIVVGGCGPLVATLPITVTNGGSGYTAAATNVAGDTVTMTNGLVLKVTWAPGGVVANTSATNVYPGVAVVGTGAVTSWPSGGVFTQVSNTGAGVGLIVTATQSALPLSTTILGSFAGGVSIPLAANCSQTFTGGTQWVTWGHDDSAAIQAAINSGYSTVILPPGHTYGLHNTVNLNTSLPQILDMQGSIVVALDATGPMFQSNTNGAVFGIPFRGKVRGGIIECMGVATIGILHGSDLYDYDDVTVQDCLTNNVQINKVGGGGSVVINNQFRFQMYNNATVLPNYPINCISIPYTGATDNQFLPGQFWVGCQQSAITDQAFGTLYQGPIHAYTVLNGPIFNLTGGAYNIDNIYPDNPVGNYCGVALSGSNNTLSVWRELVSSYNQMNQGGVCTPTTGTSVISNGIFSGSGLPAANGCQTTTGGSGQYSTIWYANQGCSLQNPQTPEILAFNSQAALTAAGATNYCPAAAAACSASSVTNVVTVPRSCLLQNFYFTPTNGDIGSTNTYIATILSAGAATAITCTITGTGTTTPGCSDLTHTAQVNAGSPLEIKVVTSASATGVRVYGAIECLAYH